MVVIGAGVCQATCRASWSGDAGQDFLHVYKVIPREVYAGIRRGRDDAHTPGEDRFECQVAHVQLWDHNKAVGGDCVASPTRKSHHRHQVRHLLARINLCFQACAIIILTSRYRTSAVFMLQIRVFVSLLLSSAGYFL
jgi:hypothetical protein